ncbi:four helix bundle protein [Oscillochloris sp. ZM17-4]|uniref:four helix bundle protein n=1 Tax=Oscillochloris sp. ZM17-4 TaxID=2866714 RepID=UPI001C73721D|nr:four helix bundle protein [Oscillochloris sp. ZM17-4]MBX0330171.1 four helix bundle protein [Oscillochloris sp. ZM17-4]
MSEQESPLRPRTKAYALRIIKLYGALPKTPEAQVIGQQLLRSGTSVGANYREGSRGRSNAEMAAKFDLCIQELDETGYWIELLIESGLVAESLLVPLLDETNQLIAMFTSAVRKLRRKGDTQKP